MTARTAPCDYASWAFLASAPLRFRATGRPFGRPIAEPTDRHALTLAGAGRFSLQRCAELWSCCQSAHGRLGRRARDRPVAYAFRTHQTDETFSGARAFSGGEFETEHL